MKYAELPYEMQVRMLQLTIDALQKKYNIPKEEIVDCFNDSIKKMTGVE